VEIDSTPTEPVLSQSQTCVENDNSITSKFPSDIMNTSSDEAEVPPDDRPMFVKLQQHFNTVSQTECNERIKLPPLRFTKRNQLMSLVSKVNYLCQFLPTINLKATTDLMFAAAQMVTDIVGVHHRDTIAGAVSPSTIPSWKVRLQNKLEFMRKDLSRLISVQTNQLRNSDVIKSLHYRYLDKGMSLPMAIEILRQKVAAAGKKLSRYTSRVDSFHQNRKFVSDQHGFYKELCSEMEPTHGSRLPNSSEVVNFWSTLWGNTAPHNAEASWIPSVDASLHNLNTQENITVTPRLVTSVAKRLNNWKSPGPDCVHNFWIKHLTNLHGRLASQIQDVVDGEVPNWLNLGRTVLILKNKAIGAEVVTNYRPITCLSNIWKLITSIVSKSIVSHLNSNCVWPWEQKGCKQRSRGTKDHLLVDKLIMFLTRRRRRNLQMTWIDYRKAYDSVPHSWILKVLSMYKVADNIRSFLMNSMSSWRVTLILNREVLGCVCVNRGIFQGDSLSPLLFVMCLFPLTTLLRQTKKGFIVDGDAISHLLYMDDLKLYAKSEEDMKCLVNTVRIFSTDIGMTFGFEKCATVLVKRGNVVSCDDIDLPAGNIRSLSLDSAYKYLGVMEAGGFRHSEVKSSVRKVYKQRLRLLLKSKLNSLNQIQAINSFAVPVIRYTAGIIDWTLQECAELDRITRKQMTLYKALHPRADVDRLYVNRKKGGRGLLSISDVVKMEKFSLSRYVSKSNEMIMKKVRDNLFHNTNCEVVDRSTVISKHVELWRNKALHGQWPKLMEELDADSFCWLRNAYLNPVTESLLVAAQDQALNTNWLSCHIHGTVSSDLCRRCKMFPETIEHIVAGCPSIAQTVYLDRHNAVTSAVHWSLCSLCGFSRSTEWWQHQPQPVLDNDSYKLLYDFNMYTDRRISARRPDIVCVDKCSGCTRLIDVACVMDRHVVDKHRDKAEKYLDLAVELQTLWNTRVEIVPLIFGALGTVHQSTIQSFKLLQLHDIRVHQLVKTVLLRTATIIRRHFGLPSSS